MERFWKTVLSVCLFYLAAAMMVAPVRCVEAAREAIALCLDVVIPSLFPFFICSNLFLSLGVANLLSRRLSGLMRPLFGVPGSGALAAVLGVVSGYPIGASCAAGLYLSGSCTKTEAERLLTFCNNSGPLFILGAVGVGMLHDQRLGALLYGTHLVSAFFTGLLFRRYRGEVQSRAVALPPAAVTGKKNAAAAVGCAVADSVDSIFKVCGFVILFAVFCAALPPRLSHPFVYSFLEITGGIEAMLDGGILPEGILLPVVALVLALSGVSVMLQTAGIILPAGLSLKPYLLGKTVQAGLAFVFTWIVLRLWPIARRASVGEIFIPKLPGPKQLLAFASVELLLCGAILGGLYLIAWILEQKRR